jgi:hypothetical protein
MVLRMVLSTEMEHLLHPSGVSKPNLPFLSALYGVCH